MNTTVLPFITLLALSVPAAVAEENKKLDAPSGEARVDIGPINVSVAVSGREGSQAQKRPYLGVVTGPVSPQLRAQLDLAEGMGLSVEAVSKDSPAEKAGLRQYDVLKKFNDQILCAQEQLSVLVKAAGKDAGVSLVVLRGGKEMNLAVTLGEHDAPIEGRARFSINGVPGMSIDVPDLGNWRGGFGAGFGNPYDTSSSGAAARGSAGIHQNFDEMKKRNEARQKEVQGQIDEAMKRAQEAARKGSEGADRAEKQFKTQVFSFYPNSQSQSVITITDTEGTVEITDANGHRTVKIKDASGKEIHAGSLDTKADHEGVPENFRAKVRDAESKIKTTGEGVLRKKLEKKTESEKSSDGSI